MRKLTHLVVVATVALVAGLMWPVVAQTNIANNAAEMLGKTVMLADGATPRTVTNLFTFDRDPNPPFAVTSGSAKVTNLDADLLDGLSSAAFLTSTTWTVVLSTTAVSQNNWAPGLSGHTVIYWSGAANISITGLAGGVSGQIVRFRNTGTFVATFAYNSASSSAGNKLFNTITSQGTPVAAGGHVDYQYDGTQWRLVDHEQGAWITPAYSAGDYTAQVSTWGVDSGDITTNAYRLVGNTVTWMWALETTDVGGAPTSLRFTIDPAFVPTKRLILPVKIADAAVNVIGYIDVNPAQLYIVFSRIDGSAMTMTAADNTAVEGQVSFEVN